METFHIILQSKRLVVLGNRWQSLHKSSLNIKFFRSKLLSIGNKDSFYCQKQSPRGVHKNLKQRLWHRCSPVNFAKFLRTPFFIEHIWWLLLYCDLPVNLNSIFMTLSIICDGAFLGTPLTIFTKNLYRMYFRVPIYLLNHLSY